ncbi:Uncharacterised protein [Vibrio cholerae]|nr:Uncharacterised protein [Vibrio cholerae]
MMWNIKLGQSSCKQGRADITVSKLLTGNG